MVDAPKIEQRLVAEEWRAIPKFPNYEVSSLGRVRSLNHISKDGRSIKGRVLQTWSAGEKLNYEYVSLGSGYKSGVHRLVALAFHGEPTATKCEAAHLNGNSKDNRAENIQWCSHQENEDHKKIHGTRVVNRVYGQPWHKPRGPKPSIHPNASAIRERREQGASLATLAMEFGYSKSGMATILKRRV